MCATLRSAVAPDQRNWRGGRLYRQRGRARGCTVHLVVSRGDGDKDEMGWMMGKRMRIEAQEREEQLPPALPEDAWTHGAHTIGTSNHRPEANAIGRGGGSEKRGGSGEGWTKWTKWRGGGGVQGGGDHDQEVTRGDQRMPPPLFLLLCASSSSSSSMEPASCTR